MNVDAIEGATASAASSAAVSFGSSDVGVFLPPPDDAFPHAYDSATCFTADGPAATADGAMAEDQGAGVTTLPITDDATRKRRRKRNHTTQDTRKHLRRMEGFAAAQDGDPGPDPTPDEGHLVGDGGGR